MKQVLHVEVNNYNIEISNDKLEFLKSDLDKIIADKKCLYVISKKVYKLYGKLLSLNKNEILFIPDGEKEKNYKNYLRIINKAYEMGLTRKDVMVAIGGGVIGDITGFAASTYMRGISYIQVPTTLLSMVDSSVGGKTAINIPEGKNIIGAFYQPDAVFININFLKTLPKKELRSGLGEILKYAFIEGNCEYEKPLFFYEYLSLCHEKFFEMEKATIMRIIDYSLKLKISVVEKDEKEVSLRKVLNLGHTLGHALESITDYQKFTHGEAVVFGIFFALNVAYKKGLINYSYYRLSVELLEKYGFKNIDICRKFEPIELANLMLKDKKALNDEIVMLLPCEKKRVEEARFSRDEILELLK